jgi:hypothetical protein
MTTSAEMFDALRAGGEKWRETRCRLLLRSDDQHERGGSGMTAKLLIVEESGNPSSEGIDLTPVLSE